MKHQLKEYTGIGASGGNSTDGNEIPSPRPFIDDEAEMDNYLMKNRYGGEGGHYRKEPAFPNPNRTRFTKFEENMKNSKRNLSLDDKAKLYFMGMMKAGLIDTLPENPKAAFVQAMMDSELASILGDEEDPRNMDEVNEDLDLGHEDNEPHMRKGDLYSIGKNSMALYKMVDQFDGPGEVDFPSWWQAKVTKARDYLKGAREYLDYELKKPQIDIAVMEETGTVTTDSEEKAEKMAKKGIDVNLKEINQSDLLRDYISSRKNVDLQEQMKKYKTK